MMYQVCTCPQSNLTGGDPHCPIHGHPPEYKIYSYCESCDALRADLAAALAQRDVFKTNVDTLVESCENVMKQRDAALAQIADEKQKVASLEEYMLKGVAFRDELQARVKVLERLIDAGRKLFDSLGSVSTHHTGGVCITGLKEDWEIKKLFIEYRASLSTAVYVKENVDADRRPA
jgi:hypothetical protein